MGGEGEREGRAGGEKQKVKRQRTISEGILCKD